MMSAHGYRPGTSFRCAAWAQTTDVAGRPAMA